MFRLLGIVLLACLNIGDATKRPIIGVLAQEIESDDPYKVYNFTSYFAASYVKAVEASGARVVPVFIRREISYYKDMATKVNGFLFTGGNSDLMSHNGVARSSKIIMDTVIEMNKQGDHIPLLGVCQGMELMAILSNGWNPILSPCNVESETLSITFLPGYKESSLYKNAPEEDLYTLSHLPSTSNHHEHCITQKNLTLTNLTQWDILSTSVSNDGFVFVSSMEWNKLPIAAVQFHPEKLAYEWKPYQNIHDAKSISAARLFYDWLIAHARKNNHSFSTTQEEQDALIYNYNPTYTGKTGQYDTQDYYFIDPPDILENDVYLV